MTSDDESFDNYLKFVASLIDNLDNDGLALIAGYCVTEVAVRAMCCDKNAGQA